MLGFQFFMYKHERFRAIWPTKHKKHNTHSVARKILGGYFRLQKEEKERGEREGEKIRKKVSSVKVTCLSTKVVLRYVYSISLSLRTVYIGSRCTRFRGSLSDEGTRTVASASRKRWWERLSVGVRAWRIKDSNSITRWPRFSIQSRSVTWSSLVTTHELG